MVSVNSIVYTSGSKIAEHGGDNAFDRSVALLVVTALVQTTQVTPTMLRAFGYESGELQAVKIEGTTELPALSF